MPRARLSFLVVWSLGMAGCGPADQEASRVPLYRGLGDHHYGITTTDALAQDYFDQGLRLYYAFNHTEAIRSFGEAQRLDPSAPCAGGGRRCPWARTSTSRWTKRQGSRRIEP